MFFSSIGLSWAALVSSTSSIGASVNRRSSPPFIAAATSRADPSNSARKTWPLSASATALLARFTVLASRRQRPPRTRLHDRHKLRISVFTQCALRQSCDRSVKAFSYQKQIRRMLRGNQSELLRYRCLLMRQYLSHRYCGCCS